MMKAKCSSLASISKLSVTLIYFIPMLSKTLLRKPFKKGPPLDIMSFHTIGLHGSLWFEINATRHATRSRNGTFSSQNWLPSQQAVHDKIKNGISLQQQLTNTVHADIRGRERTKFSWLRKIFPPDDMMAIIRCLGCEYCRLRLFDRHKEAKAYGKEEPFYTYHRVHVYACSIMLIMHYYSTLVVVDRTSIFIIYI